eukprot:247905_1
MRHVTGVTGISSVEFSTNMQPPGAYQMLDQSAASYAFSPQSGSRPTGPAMPQAARGNYTALGTALLGARVAGLQPHGSGAGPPATASVSPYAATKKHAQPEDLYSVPLDRPDVARRPVQEFAAPPAASQLQLSPGRLQLGANPLVSGRRPKASARLAAVTRMGLGRSPREVLLSQRSPQASARSAAPGGGSDEDEPGLSAEQTKDLFKKCLNNRYHQVEELFSMGIPVDAVDEHGNTCLHVACQNGNKRMIKTCLRWRSNINIQNKDGNTPLHYLFAYKYEELAAYLISKGAKDSIHNKFGLTCYDGLRPEGDSAR